jgi:hypothetical protein
VRLSLSNAWEDSRRIFKRDGGLLLAVALALLVLPQIVAGLIAPTTVSDPGFAGRVIAIAAALLGVIGQLAIIRLALGPSTTVGQAIGHGMRRFPAALGAVIILMVVLAAILIPLMVILLAAGLVEVPAAGQQPSGSFTAVVLLLLVACIAIAARLMLMVPVASAENTGPLAILKRSWALTRGHYWGMLGLEMLLLIAALFLLASSQFVGGILAEVIGGDLTPMSLSALIFAIIVAIAQAAFTLLASVMLARVYLQLAGRGEAQASVPSTGT